MDSSTTFLFADKYKSPYIVIPPEIIDDTYVCFKLFYNDRYVIIMGKSLFRQVEIIRSNLTRFFKNEGKVNHRSDKNRDDYCAMFYKYVYDNPNGKFWFEVLGTKMSSPYKLLQINQLALDAGENDPNCLNLNNQPIVSRFVQTPDVYLEKWQVEYKKKNMWINRGHYLNFRKWQYNRKFKTNGY